MWFPTKQPIFDVVNTRIRTGGTFDVVIDFAATWADPKDPRKFDRAVQNRRDSGDPSHGMANPMENDVP